MVSPCLGTGHEYVVSAACLWRPFLVSCFRQPTSTECEGGALVGPVKRDASQQQLDGQGVGLAALDDGLHDVGGEISKPQKPTDMGIAEPKALRNLPGIGEFTLPQPAHP